MLTIKTLNTKCGEVKRSSEALAEKVQTIMLNAAGHAYEFSDVDVFNNLLKSYRGANRQMIVKFAKEYCFVRFVDGKAKLNKAAVKDAVFNSGEEVVNYLTETAPKWDAEQESVKAAANAVDAVQAIENLTKRLNTAVSKHNVGEFELGAAQAAIAELQKTVDLAAHTIH